MREAYLQGAILRALRKRGGWWVKYHAGPRYSTGGVPDILGAYRGLFVAMEVKVEDARVTPLQAATQQEMRQKGKAIVVVVRSVKQALKVLDAIDEYVDEYVHTTREERSQDGEEAS